MVDFKDLELEANSVKDIQDLRDIVLRVVKVLGKIDDRFFALEHPERKDESS